MRKDGSRKQDVYTFESPVRRFWVQGPYEGNGEGVGDSKEVVGLFANVFKADGQEEGLREGTGKQPEGNISGWGS